MTLRWTRRAERLLVEIGQYIAQDKPGAARRWMERLRLRARQAAEHPRAGRIVPGFWKRSTGRGGWHRQTTSSSTG